MASSSSRFALLASSTLMLAALVISSPGYASGFDPKDHHDLGGHFLSQDVPKGGEESKYVYRMVKRVVGYTFREKVHDSDVPYLVKFCDGACFDAERGTLMPMLEVAEMLDHKNSGKVATFNYILNDLEKGLEHYRDGAKDEAGKLPKTFLTWVPSKKQREEEGATVKHYTGSVTKAGMKEWLEMLKIPLGLTKIERNKRKEEL